MIAQPTTTAAGADARTLLHDAAASVGRRGFFDPNYIEPAYTDAMLMSQFARMVEEAGELEQAIRAASPLDQIASEAADVFIVAAAFAAVARLDADPGPHWIARGSLSSSIADLARALRTSRRDQEQAIRHIVAHCYQLAALRGFGLARAIGDKLASDEGRGYRHNGEIPE